MNNITQHDTITTLEADVCQYMNFSLGGKVITENLIKNIASVISITILNNGYKKGFLPRLESLLQANKGLRQLSIYYVQFNDNVKFSDHICIGGETGSQRTANKMYMDKEILPKLSKKQKTIYEPVLASELFNNYINNSKAFKDNDNLHYIHKEGDCDE